MQLTFKLKDLLNPAFWSGILRAFGGALVFSLPMLMTMEMWWIGFYIHPLPLLLLLLLNVPLLVALSRVVGFRKTDTLLDDVVDAFVAYFIGVLSALLALALMGVLTLQMPLQEVVGKVALQAVPASIGALLAASQLGEQTERGEIGTRSGRYLKELVIVTAGALLLSLNLAPTEEMVLISYKMTQWHALLMILMTLVVMEAFARAAARRDADAPSHGLSPLMLFLRYTTAAYAIALLISFYMLWTFDRTAGMELEGILMMTVVLGFPAGIGAAGARLIL